MLEVLISIVIIAIGLLGMAALQGKAQQAELESYQRAQALLLVQDMVSRINNNRTGSDCYRLADIASADGQPYSGYKSAAPSVLTPTGGTCSAGSAVADLAQDDIDTWDNMLDGSAEQLGGATNVGAMIGARGCIMHDDVNEVFTIAVAWQGNSTTIAPSNNCAKGEYGDDRQRRVITATVQIANLE